MLTEIGVAATTPRIEACNTLDLFEGDAREEMIVEAGRRQGVVAISAVTGEGANPSRPC